MFDKGMLRTGGQGNHHPYFFTKIAPNPDRIVPHGFQVTAGMLAVHVPSQGNPAYISAFIGGT
jgi:hypothetical protein